MKKKKTGYFFATLFLVSILFSGFTGSALAEVTQVSIASTSSASGYYAWCVAQAQVVNKYAKDLNVTLVGGGRGGIAFAKLVKKGTVDWSAMGTLAIPNHMYRGTGAFKGDPWQQVRLFFMREIMIYRMYVRKDSGVKTWSDLKGKKFNPGTPGSTNARNTSSADKTLGTGMTIVPGTVADAKKAIKGNRIVGMNKSSPTDRFDGGMKELHYTTPLTVIGFTREQADKIQAKYPLITFRDTPAGFIKELPDLGPLVEMSSIGLTLTSSNLSEEIGYRIIKALHQHWDEVAESYPPVGSYDPIADLIKSIPKGAEVPLHAGVVRYAKEAGIDVPKAFIPPEYK